MTPSNRAAACLFILGRTHYRAGTKLRVGRLTAPGPLTGGDGSPGLGALRSRELRSDGPGPDHHGANRKKRQGGRPTANG
ncbi:hypothetical protein Nans01_36970 [Nocardiopsis ansamitocini]|uniref:Uncharacterized protein n=1 Tax=Nocardiopsis ansamitocini TaxID=1670832 RepID=A0A9W6P915_9ACTN|nr:hypothetical protein Nans01_36970 [Nocardiopsis ansamitocini]